MFGGRDGYGQAAAGGCATSKDVGDMQYAGNTGQSGRGAPHGGKADWSADPEENRDWKKVVLIAGLGILSWVATYVGMLELIEANLGDLPLIHKIIVGFSVGMLMIMIVWLLDQLFAPLPFFTRFLYALGYVFLTLISVGFGFGFYWKGAGKPVEKRRARLKEPWARCRRRCSQHRRGSTSCSRRSAR